MGIAACNDSTSGHAIRKHIYIFSGLDAFKVPSLISQYILLDWYPKNSVCLINFVLYLASPPCTIGYQKRKPNSTR